MAYFLYQITERPIRLLEMLEQHDAYRDAAARAKQLRSAQAPGATGQIKMIFADNELHAEDLLNQVREAPPGPDD